MRNISLRQLQDKDIPLFKKWLFLPHVAKWYHEPLEWTYEIEKRNSEFKWIHHYIVEHDGRAIGFCQYYEYCNSGETWHGNIEIDGTYSIDYMIGEADYLKKGYGKEMIKELVYKVRLIPNAKRIIVQPEAENLASGNALLSSGFYYDSLNKLYLMDL